MKTFVCGMVLLCAFPNVFADQADSIRIASLRNIAPVKVTVENLGVGGEAIGLTENEVRAHIELKLRQTGIEIKNEDWKAFLYVRVQLMKINQSKTFIYTAEIKLTQPVTLTTTNALTLATTWENGSIGIAPQAEVKKVILETLDSTLVYFLNDYLSANPNSK